MTPLPQPIEDTCNAFVLPGGKVFVYTGMLELLADDDELGVILAHEVCGPPRSRLNKQIPTLIIDCPPGRLVTCKQDIQPNGCRSQGSRC